MAPRLPDWHRLQRRRDAIIRTSDDSANLEEAAA